MNIGKHVPKVPKYGDLPIRFNARALDGVEGY
jgi:hypothetical protein